ncbi:hypothetical protein K469DRAFT_774733 [Zopfia rhizophila CBS 207.26]|uniref:Uncharacterized protein n=1 Tax=Zopfia rhizophila CBS 207.26 TaxID=1314779 RepID=A0A6A6EU55_9PEZI|nr:hypothetical protein K469DRAFT_774733 [Zopfia rhizophila CBS 207.26]
MTRKKSELNPHEPPPEEFTINNSAMNQFKQHDDRNDPAIAYDAGTATAPKQITYYHDGNISAPRQITHHHDGLNSPRKQLIWHESSDSKKDTGKATTHYEGSPTAKSSVNRITWESEQDTNHGDEYPTNSAMVKWQPDSYDKRNESEGADERTDRSDDDGELRGARQALSNTSVRGGHWRDCDMRRG